MTADARTGSMASDDPDVESIVRAATDLVLASGHAGLQMADVAWRAGLPVERVRELFASINDILIAVLEWRDVEDIVRVRQAMAESDDHDPRHGLRELVARNCKQANIVRLYSHFDALALDPQHPAHEYFKRRYRESRDILADFVSPICDQPERVADQVLAAMDGLQLQWLREPDSFDLLAAWDAIAERIFIA